MEEKKSNVQDKNRILDLLFGSEWFYKESRNEYYGALSGVTGDVVIARVTFYDKNTTISIIECCYGRYEKNEALYFTFGRLSTEYNLSSVDVDEVLYSISL